MYKKKKLEFNFLAKGQLGGTQCEICHVEGSGRFDIYFDHDTCQHLTGGVLYLSQAFWTKKRDFVKRVMPTFDILFNQS